MATTLEEHQADETTGGCPTCHLPAGEADTLCWDGCGAYAHRDCSDRCEGCDGTFCTGCLERHDCRARYAGGIQRW